MVQNPGTGTDYVVADVVTIKVGRSQVITLCSFLGLEFG